MRESWRSSLPAEATLPGVPTPTPEQNSSLTPDFRSVLHSASLASVVRVEGLLQVNEKEEIVAIEDVWGLEVFELPEAPWSTRLLEIAGLAEGWLDGEGSEISFASLDLARDFIREFVDRDISVPGVFPMPDGGVQLEWQLTGSVVSVEISPDLALMLYRLDVEADSEEERLNADLTSAIDFVVGAVRG
jgi:hypothetical protein